MFWVVGALVVGAAFGALVVHRVLSRRFAEAAEAAPALDQAAGQVRERPQCGDQPLAEMKAALDALPHGVVVVDGRGRLVARNAKAEHFTGVTYLDALVDQAVETHLRDALDGEERVDSLEVYGPPRRTLLVRGSRVVVEGEAVGALATVEDITDRVRLDAVRTDLVANLSHELKTPVGAIALLAETLADEDEPAVIARLAPKLISEAHRLSRIIDELLELSRIELGGQTLSEVVDLGAVAAEAVALHAALAAGRGIEVHVEVLPDPPGSAGSPSVLGNRRQLLSAVSNLVENAVKYSDAGAEVRVEVVAVEGTVELAVADHGIGIPARDKDRIFERFYRVDKARGRETGGSGLGLSIVRHVMANHGGQVTVTSVEGDGSTFTLRLPVAGASAGHGIAQAG